MIVTSVQIKTVKTQKHLYCPVFTKSTAASLFSGFAAFFYSSFSRQFCFCYREILIRRMMYIC